MFSRIAGVARATRALTPTLSLLATGLTISCSQAPSEVSSSSTVALVSAQGLTVESTRNQVLPASERFFVLHNTTGHSLKLDLRSDSDWVQLPSNESSLAPGEQERFEVELSNERVAELPASIHMATIEVIRSGQGGMELEIPVQLLLLPEEGKLAVLEKPEFTPAGTEDGEFFPKSTARTFVNQGELALSWMVETSADWLDPQGVTGGTLAPGEELRIDIELDDWIARSAGVGRHEGNIRLLDRATKEELFNETIVMHVTSGIMMRNGWSQLRGSPGSRIVFVSDTYGNDSNDGLSPQFPKKTIAAGKALMRHGEPDYLLLRRGDVFQEGLGQWKTSGRSETEPQVVSTYGPPTVRPILNTGTTTGLVTHGGGGSPPTIDNVAIVGLHFNAHTHTGTGIPIGIALHRPSTNFLIEDCLVEKYNTGLVVQPIGGRHTDIRIRRSVVVDSFGVNDGNPQGLYCVATDGFLVEECVFDTNGWQPDIPGATADIFSHNIYCDVDNSSVIVRGNILVNGASHGLQMRAGGTTHNNFFAKNAIAFMMAGASGPQQDTAHATLNVIMDGRDIGPGFPRGWGIDFNNVIGGEMRRNIVANSTEGGIRVPLLLDGHSINGGVHNVDVVNNIVWNWGGSVWFTGTSSQLTNINFSNNAIQNAIDGAYVLDHFNASNQDAFTTSNNDFFSDQRPVGTWINKGGINQSVPDWKADVGDTGSMRARFFSNNPDVTLADYAAFLGLPASHDAFMAEARLQSRQYWRRRYTALGINSWIRTNFQ